MLHPACQFNFLADGFQPWTDSFRCFLREQHPLGRPLQQCTNKTELVALQKFIVEQIPVELDGYFAYLLALPRRIEPAVRQLTSHQHQVVTVRALRMVAHDAFDATCIGQEVQFKLVVIMQGKIKHLISSLKQPAANSASVVYRAEGVNHHPAISEHSGSPDHRYR